MYNIVQPEGEKYYKIGDLASKLGTTQRALRFYEKKGLITSKRQGLHRLYTARDRSRLELILKAKQLGFTLAEIRDMISDQANEPQFSPSLHIIDEQISMLNRRLAEIESANMMSEPVQHHPLSLGLISAFQ
jgi:DNA-binding transcriptional MerR regulator